EAGRPSRRQPGARQPGELAHRNDGTGQRRRHQPGPPLPAGRFPPTGGLTPRRRVHPPSRKRIPAGREGLGPRAGMRSAACTGYLSLSSLSSFGSSFFPFGLAGSFSGLSLASPPSSLGALLVE